MCGFKEKKLGAFYKKGKSLLHFDEGSTGLFADLERELISIGIRYLSKRYCCQQPVVLLV